MKVHYQTTHEELLSTGHVWRLVNDEEGEIQLEAYLFLPCKAKDIVALFEEKMTTVWKGRYKFMELLDNGGQEVVHLLRMDALPFEHFPLYLVLS